MFLGLKYTNRTPARVSSSFKSGTSALIGTDDAAMPNRNIDNHSDDNDDNV
jgi:hypothetical protein